jgi:hypothetical protein
VDLRAWFATIDRVRHGQRSLLLSSWSRRLGLLARRGLSPLSVMIEKVVIPGLVMLVDH